MRFDSLQGNINKAIINIANQNKLIKKIVFILIKIFMYKNRKNKYIGFMNYELLSMNKIENYEFGGISLIEIKKLLK